LTFGEPIKSSALTAMASEELLAVRNVAVRLYDQQDL